MIDNGLDVRVGANIQRLRQALGMSQAELAGYLGENYRQQTVLKIEKGTRPLRLAEAAAVADALAVSVEDLYGGDERVRTVEQVIGMTRMVTDAYGQAQTALVRLEHRRDVLDGMVGDGADLPEKVQEIAADWSRNDLLESCVAWARRETAEAGPLTVVANLMNG